jgi:hypothetical protein
MCSAADAMTNSMMPGMAPSLRRMKSMVQPVILPSVQLGQLVVASIRRPC